MTAAKKDSAFSPRDQFPAVQNSVSGNSVSVQAGGDAAAAGGTGRRRVKKEFTVLSFATYENAMEMEAFCHARGIPGRLIPLPPQVDAGCGLCWRMEPQEWEAAEEQIRTQGPVTSGIHRVRMWAMKGK